MIPDLLWYGQKGVIQNNPMFVQKRLHSSGWIDGNVGIKIGVYTDIHIIQNTFTIQYIALC